MNEDVTRFKMICKDCIHFAGNGMYCENGRLVYEFDYCYNFDKLKLYPYVITTSCEEVID